MENYVFIAGMLGLAFMSSCKKEKEDSFASDQRVALIGRWEHVTSGVDLNENGQLDVSEYETRPGSTRYYYTYNSNDAGIFRIAYPVGGPTSLEIPYTWRLTGEAQYLETDYHRGSKPTVLKIKELTTETLSMYDTVYKPATFLLLRKVQ